MPFDVAVVGASLAGSFVAALARDRGWSVVVLEARHASQRASRPDRGSSAATACVPAWVLEAADLTTADTLARPAHVHVVAPDVRATLVPRDVVLVDPAVIRHALLERALRAGAELVCDARVVGLDASGVTTTTGSIEARIVVDASGDHGAQLLGERVAAPRDTALIARETCDIRDMEQAAAHLAAIGAKPREPIVWLGPGGTGTAAILLIDGEHVDLAALRVADQGPTPTARAVLRRIVRELPWIGDVRTEAAREIVLGLRSTLASEHVALVGDAAGITWPSAGASVTRGIVSAQILVDAISQDGDLSTYERRLRGASVNLAAFDLAVLEVLRTSPPGELASALRSRLGERLFRRGMLERRAPWLGRLRLETAVRLASIHSAATRTANGAPAASSTARLAGGPA